TGSLLASPIMADSQAVRDASLSVMERYAVKEPVEYITIARDEVGSPVYLIEEPSLTADEKTIYGKLVDVLQYELKAPYEGVDPKKYFDEQSKRIITKYAMSLGIT